MIFLTPSPLHKSIYGEGWMRSRRGEVILPYIFPHTVKFIVWYITYMENQTNSNPPYNYEAYKPTPEPPLPKAPKDQSWWELVKFALMALAIVIPVRMFVAEPFVVSGSSMVPTFVDRDYLIIDKISYLLNNPKRDDVVVFKYPNDPSKFFIKRIIALPGETIDIKGNNITIINAEHPGGLRLDQPFVKNEDNNDVYLRLKADEYYVMGDNRIASSDSRVWGPLKREFMTGKVLLRLLPLSNMGIKPGEFTQAE